MEAHEGITTEDLRLFYSSQPSFSQLYKWLSYHKNDTQKADRKFSKREFNLTIRTNAGEEIYIRNQSYVSQEEFKADVIKISPHKFDIGGVYPYQPKNHASYADHSKQVVEREFVFDIDMDDYSSVRRCCDSGKAKKLCLKCWPFLHIAIQVIRKVLKQVFGLEKFVFIFSGRRGIHCWVSDKRARVFNGRVRASILDFLSLSLQIGELSVPVQPFYDHLHPFFKKIYAEVLLPNFEDQIIEKQDLFENEEAWQNILRFVPNQTQVKDRLNDTWNNEPGSSGLDKWKLLKKLVGEDINKSSQRKSQFTYTSDPVVNIVFAYTYPRFDKHVSIGMNHLLKSPFCIHPDTGLLCTPVDDKNSLEFNPETVPNLDSLLEEIANGKSIKQSSVAPFISLFATKMCSPALKKPQQNLSGEPGSPMPDIEDSF